MLDVFDETLPVAFPLLLEFPDLGMFAAGQLHSDFEAVGENVVEVLHATLHDVPGNTNNEF